MNRTAAATAAELERFEGSICFVFDSSSLLFSEKEEVVDELSDCIAVFRNAQSNDTAVIPRAVMKEINAGQSWSHDVQDIAARRVQELKDLLPVRKMIESWKSPKPVAIGIQEHEHHWKLFDQFVRNNDENILSCALYYRGLRGGETTGRQKRTAELKPAIDGVKEVVLVTEDQVMALRATAVYEMKSISVTQLYQVVFR